MACVNVNSPEFQNLLEDTGMNQHILAAKVTVWQEINGFESFPSLADLGIEAYTIVEKTAEEAQRFNDQLRNNTNQLTNIAEDNFADWSSETNESEDPFLC
jgi:hypothetical protein